MEHNKNVIFFFFFLEMFDGKLSYRSLLNLIREKKLPAMKAGKRYLFSRQVVEKFKRRQLGIA